MKLPKNFPIDETKLVSLDTLLKKKSIPLIPLSSGADSFNNILGGGFKKGCVYVFFGENRTGKTQLCHQMCIQAFKHHQLTTSHEKKNSNEITLYYDTENTFRSERIEELAGLNNLHYRNVLNSILVSKIMSNDTLLMAINLAKQKITSHPIKLLIVDSINNYYRSEKGDPSLSFSHTKNIFLRILEEILELTVKHDLISLLTAQITPNFIKNETIKELPVGLHYLDHYFSEFFYLSHKKDNGNKNLCYIHLVNSHQNLEKKLLYEVTSHGIVDYKF
ncbi:MAG: DNA repair and recombination protein RadA [Promethearchaeota archaeon]|nr:MAG: DNA repair and recombination protein RadA [Candidatus Lokiarchaeota archaeon]